MTALDLGNYLVTWRALDSDASGIYGRIFGPDGTARGPEFLLNTNQQGDQRDAGTVYLGGTSFVTAWQTPGGIAAQQFSTSGEKIGPETLVASLSSAEDPAITPNFVAWNTSASVDAQRFLVPRYGSEGNDTLLGDGDDTMFGGGGDDVLGNLGAGPSEFFGQAGNDTLGSRLPGERLDGGAGSDTASYEGVQVGVQASLDQPGGNTGTAQGDIYVSIENLTGSQGNDTLRGDANSNVLSGNAGDDLLEGLTGPDTLIGGPGNDTLVPGPNEAGLDGGAGSDTAVLVRGTAPVSVDLRAGTGTFDGQALVISAVENIVSGGGNDSLDGSAGSNGILGANHLQAGAGDDFLYGDGLKIAFTPELSGQVTRLYRATLDRGPDAAGHLGWVTDLFEGTRDLVGVSDAFIASPEFQARFGALDAEGFVTLLYQTVLDRAPDADGLAGWLAQLATGASRAEVVLGFSESAEFRAATAAEVQSFTQGQTDSIWSDDVYRLYRTTLDREPDLAGFQGFTTALGSGTPFASAVTGFVASTEFQNTYGTLDNAAFVDLLYNNVFGRQGDAAGVAGWLGVLAAGGPREQVVEGFSQSREFINATTAPLEAWMRARGIDDTLDGGTGSNVMTGGRMSDVFVFDAAQGGTNRVMDLEAWDSVEFRGFGYADDAAARAHLAQAGGAVTFSDQGTQITFEGATLAMFDDDMILV
ncbi:MAG: DUF4214 domain-containing protein [Rhodobacteraceae bacterium]|nr:DUF4214 domain-containing protein [Paracoccaceae bacterium]